MDKCVKCGKEIKLIKEAKCDRKLDGKPVDKKFILTYEKCPECGCMNIDGSDIILEALDSEKYKEAQGYRAALILVSDHSTRAKILLNACWAAEEVGKEEDARKFRINAIREMVEELKIRPMVNLGLACIDSFRQLERFDDAAILLNSIKDNFDGKIFSNPSEYIRLVFEAKLIENKDSKPYNISDVKLI